MTEFAGGGGEEEEAGEDGVLLDVASGAVAGGDLVVDDAVAQDALGRIVGRLNIVAAETDE